MPFYPTVIDTAYAHAVAIDKSGAILVVGSCGSMGSRATVFVFDPDGGSVMICNGPLNNAQADAGNTARAISIDPANRALEVGSEPTATAGVYRSFVTRLGNDYCNDPSFGGTQPGTIAVKRTSTYQARRIQS